MIDFPPTGSDPGAGRAPPRPFPVLPSAVASPKTRREGEQIPVCCGSGPKPACRCEPARVIFPLRSILTGCSSRALVNKGRLSSPPPLASFRPFLSVWKRERSLGVRDSRGLQGLHAKLLKSKLLSSSRPSDWLLLLPLATEERQKRKLLLEGTAAGTQVQPATAPASDAAGSERRRGFRPNRRRTPFRG